MASLQGLVGQIQTHFAALRTVADSVTSLSDTVILEYTTASAAGAKTVEIDLPASPQFPIIIEDVQHVVTVAFSSNTGVTVGDGSTPNLYLQTGDIAAASAKNFASSARKRSFLGTYCTTGQRLVVTVTGCDGVGQGLLIARVTRLKIPQTQGDSTTWAYNSP